MVGPEMSGSNHQTRCRLYRLGNSRLMERLAWNAFKLQAACAPFLQRVRIWCEHQEVIGVPCMSRVLACRDLNGGHGQDVTIT